MYVRMRAHLYACVRVSLRVPVFLVTLFQLTTWNNACTFHLNTFRLNTFHQNGPPEATHFT